MSARSDFNAVLRRARSAGCSLGWGGKHRRIVCPDGTVVIASGSPSDINACRNLLRDLRKAGVDI